MTLEEAKSVLAMVMATQRIREAFDLEAES